MFDVFRKFKTKGKTQAFNRVHEGGPMKDISLLKGAEPRRILQTIIDEEIPAIMSYLSRGKWHVAKVLLTELGANRLSVDLVPSDKPQPMNIQLEQPVGLSLKYGYGKFIFEAKVIALEPSPESQSGGVIVLNVPDRIEIVQRRNYYRVKVPASLKVNVLMWHRCTKGDPNQPAPDNYYKGRLIDISAGGAQLAVPTSEDPDFSVGQFVCVRFTPLPYETPILFNAQIRNILPTADGQCHCFGLQIVGLEASHCGRETLQRLVGVVEQYYKMAQSNVREQDLQPTKK